MRQHYLRVTEEDFKNASSEEWLAKWLAPGAEKSEQNGHSPGIAQDSLLLKIVQKVLEEQGLEQFGAMMGKALRNDQAPPVGLEITKIPLKKHKATSSEVAKWLTPCVSEAEWRVPPDAAKVFLRSMLRAIDWQ